MTTPPPIWLQPISLEWLNQTSIGGVASHLGMEFVEIGNDYLVGRLPVDERTRQPYGILHGGVSVVLAESLGSMGAALSSPPGSRAVGLDINANHLRSVSNGWVTGTARPIHRGRTTHVWQIDLRDDNGALSCVSRLTVAILQDR